MKLGIFSDVHDNITNVTKAYEVFSKHEIEMAICCGDLVSPFTLKSFTNWPWEIKAVFGNNEGDQWGFMRRLKKYQLNHVVYPERGYIHELTIGTDHIFVFHGHLPEVLSLAIKSQRYDYVFTGHTHEEYQKTVGKTVVVNPGSVTPYSENPDKINGSIAIVDTSTKQVDIINL